MVKGYNRNGTVKYFDSHKDRFWDKVDIGNKDDCWSWRGHLLRGYGRFKYQKKMVLAHRMAWIFTNGPIPDGLHVLHKCDNRLCCNISHLYLGSHADNMRDKQQRGTIVLASPESYAAGKAKLYSGEIWLVRKLLKSRKIPQRTISRMFKVSQKVICNINRSTKYLCREGYYC